jgi:glycosyltransferase involved in cell wall biosynthesis
MLPDLIETPAAIRQTHDSVLCSILIPCLNEERNVQGAIEAAVEGARRAACTIEVIVIDDGSTDGTAEKVLDLMQRFPEWPIRLYRHAKNQGYALSFLKGASLSKGKYCKIHCGDNVFPPETVDTLLRAINTADVILPYDFIMIGRSTTRRFLSRFYTVLVNLVSGYRLKYYNGCPILPTQKVLENISPSSGFGFQADMLCRILDSGATYSEIEVQFIERVHGTSNAITLKNLMKVADVMRLIFFRRLGLSSGKKIDSHPSLSS